MRSIDKKVSIVVPVYNQERYLAISIPSLLNQIYENIEIILVNDGSKDKSREILQYYAEIDSRIKVIDKSNGGLVDATLCGLEHSSGDFVCFLDPDDYVGSDFIKRFIDEMDDDYDFIAAGYYQDNNGKLNPIFLKEDRVYRREEINSLRQNFLLNKCDGYVSNQCFISRWNKIYSMECAQKVAKELRKCQSVSLGEDSIFTYLTLLYARKAKTFQSMNSYFYNIGNQKSMMKSSDINRYLQQCKEAYICFNRVLSEHHEEGTKQAYILYYFLINSIFQRCKNQTGNNDFTMLYVFLKRDELYKKSLKIVSVNISSKKQKIVLGMRKFLPSARCYLMMEYIAKVTKDVGKNLFRKIPQQINDFRKKGFYKARMAAQFQENRKNAFEDLNTFLPELENRIGMILEKYKNIKTDMMCCPIEKNVFVFWWDGFENAPEIVRCCLKSVRKQYSDYNIIEITKDTYKEYTDIHPEILNGYMKGNISVQTFSDVLRFNLLKNNGGIWIDSTIFLIDNFDLLKGLENKSFESVCFASSHSFLQYKNASCSWSGYFIASRKNAILVSVIDEVFREYYLKYRTYSIYFFIDAVFMICKIYGIDGDVLSKVQEKSGDMFLLSHLLDAKYDDAVMPLLTMVPQKLRWNYQSETSGTFYQCVVKDINNRL